MTSKEVFLSFLSLLSFLLRFLFFFNTGVVPVALHACNVYHPVSGFFWLSGT